MKAFTGTAAAGVALALLAACTPGTTAPSPSPTPTAATTPAETPLERQTRLDYAAAEKAYRSFNAEFNRVLQAGGSTEATENMRATAAGEYLKAYTDIVVAFKRKGVRQIGDLDIVVADPAGYSANELVLTTCEDGRKLKIVEGSKVLSSSGEVRQGLLTIRKINGSWKLWSAKGEKSDSC